MPSYRHIKKLTNFHMVCLRKILNIRWIEKVPDTEVQERAGLPSISALVRKAQLRWIGHVVRTPESRMPKKKLYLELKRHPEGQLKRFKDNLNASLKACSIPLYICEVLAADRSNYRLLTHMGVTYYETCRVTSAKEKRALRKSKFIHLYIYPTRMSQMSKDISSSNWNRLSFTDAPKGSIAEVVLSSLFLFLRFVLSSSISMDNQEEKEEYVFVTLRL
ncbi:hypothetical protein HOLleu_29333 [Holothuria leucospilota]|uniref:Uncharacterized protein n=1 Tax=Holothuria leucospilota TaxID=206669 RepID=A0A9Q1GZG3_HOLLE|nr:hypothetical protein HOLleu_29333 [Holothuria leucospilota]